MGITIIQGDLLAQPVDAIVNPANGHLRHGGGLARKIADAANGGVIPSVPSETRAARIKQRGGYSAAVAAWAEDHASAPLIPTGGAHLTSAGALPFKGVIHAVGPIWGGGQYHEADLLCSAHDSALRIARKAGYESVALPAISCGIFGYPVERAARLAVGTAITWQRGLDIRFVLFEDAHYAAYEDAAHWYGVIR